MGRGRPDLLAAMAPLALGHLLAMLGDPAALRADAVARSIGSARSGSRRGCLVIAFGVFRLLNRRHPRVARAHPADPARPLVLRDRARPMAPALMLLPIYLGICSADEI